MFTPTLGFIPTHRVIVENEDHEYALNTLVKLSWSYGSAKYAWYVDNDGMWQIMHESELEAV
jgi:hypothetical protein